MAYISLVLQSGLRKSKKKTSFEKFWLKHQGWTLYTYFCGSTSSSASTSSQVDEPSRPTADIKCSDFGENVDVGRLGPPKPESEDTEGETKFPLRCVGRECVRIEDAEQTVQEYPTDVGLWQIPATHDMSEFWAERGSEPCQNKKSEYPESRLEDGNRQVRYFPSSLFSYVHKPTQTKFDRSWLCYSESANKIFCFHCTLFASGVSDNLFCCGGFNDWKKTFMELSLCMRKAQIILSLSKNT